MNRSLQTLLAIGLVLGIGLPLWKFVIAVDEPPASAPPRDLGPISVSTEAVAPRELVLRVDAFGNLEPRRRFSITPEVAGRIEEVHPDWRPGARVELGERLVLLDRKPAALELQAAEARQAEAWAVVKTAEVELQGALRAQEKAKDQREITEREYARQVELGTFASDSLRDRAETALVAAELNEETTRIQYEGALASLEGAKARALQAQVSVDQAQDLLERMEIRAPFPGQLSGQPPGLGTMTAPGQGLGELIDTDEMVLTVRVPERDLLELRRGMSAQVRFPSDPGLEDLLRVTGEVTGIDPSADPTTRRGAVEIALYDRAPGARAANGSDQSGPRLPAGFFAQASIEVERLPDAIWIARRHVHWSEGKPVAFVVEGAGDQERAAERELVLVREHGEGFLVRSGLAAGDVLITHPLDRMRSGAVVASTRDRVP